MIKPILKISWLNLKRDHMALGLTFLLPVVFFSIFAMIFGGMGGSSTGADSDGESGGGGTGGGMEIVVVDEDGSEVSGRFVQAIDEQDALLVVSTYVDEEGEEREYSREEAHRRVRKGAYAAAVIIPANFESSFGSFSGEGVEVEVIYDAANPMALPTVSGLLQAAGFMAAPDVLVERAMGQLEEAGGTLTPMQRIIMAAIKPALRGEKAWDDISLGGEEGQGGETASASSGFQGLVQVKATNARAGDEKEETRSVSMVPYYAAGTAVMFLLFSMAGAGGALLEEEENGVLERLLTSHAPMTTLLLGKWLFFMGLGMAQVTVMFLWGAWMFDLDLFTVNHLVGFGAMTVMTAGAAAGFGILLATACRSRSQLGGLSTIVILIMSALGGSMVPKFAAPFLEETALYTINGWALDGYLKVFWYDEPGEGVAEVLMELLPQLTMLAGMGLVFLLVARGLARRWEMV